MKTRNPFPRSVVESANARLIQQHGQPSSLPRELLGIVSYRPRTVEEIKKAFAAAYTKLHQG